MASVLQSSSLLLPSPLNKVASCTRLKFEGNSFSFDRTSPRLHSRRLCKVEATVIRENEKKVNVEDTFPPKSSPGGENGGPDSEPPNGPLEKWDSVIKILDTLYQDRDYARFFVLETIARVPYFAFMSVLHLYESLGWWRKSEYIQVHFAESWNEMHHLLIMEELGGNAWWFDQFLSRSMAIFYYWMTVFMYLLSPRMASL
ncbi:Alternative oxidase [Artemisia annua]|uniref:Ubiquinol oxidase n=1 Tax=Artemisia annua TaxID=35608 RepID=A0A2U1KDA6_ARTAN|nr:Alternative oxidase [Artemisia annua]